MRDNGYSRKPTRWTRKDRIWNSYVKDQQSSSELCGSFSVELLFQAKQTQKRSWRKKSGNLPLGVTRSVMLPEL